MGVYLFSLLSATFLHFFLGVFFHFIIGADKLPKTSGSTPEDFNRAFDAVHKDWPDAQIFYLAYSAVTTCSYQSAQIAAEGRPYVTSIDTKAVSAGQHSIVVRMARLLEENPDWSMAQAVSAAKDLINRSRMCFIPNELEYLRAGGLWHSGFRRKAVDQYAKSRNTT